MLIINKIKSDIKRKDNILENCHIHNYEIYIIINYNKNKIQIQKSDWLFLNLAIFEFSKNYSDEYLKKMIIYVCKILNFYEIIIYIE